VTERARPEDPALVPEHKGGDGTVGDPAARAREVCLRLLTLAPRTRAQLAAALRKRGIPDQAANAVLGRYEDAGRRRQIRESERRRRCAAK